VTHPAVMALDEALGPLGSDRGAGVDAILRRVIGEGDTAQNVDVTVRAQVRPRPGNTQDLSGGAPLTVYDVVLSPTQILAAQWPGGHPPALPPLDPPAWLPRMTDVLIFLGNTHNVTAAGPVSAGNEIVRINLVVEG